LALKYDIWWQQFFMIFLRIKLPNCPRSRVWGWAKQNLKSLSHYSDQSERKHSAYFVNKGIALTDEPLSTTSGREIVGPLAQYKLGVEATICAGKALARAASDIIESHKAVGRYLWLTGSASPSS